MKRLLIGLLVLAGCDANGNLNLSGDTNGGNTGSNAADPPPRDPDETLTGDLATGAIVDLSWADDSGVYCWTGTENVNFNGNNVFFNKSYPSNTSLYVEADPDKGVDVSVYVMAFPTGEAQTPPDVNSLYRCETGFDQQNDNNPGQAENAVLEWNKPFDAVIGVAGANGETSGTFTLLLWREPNTLQGGDTG